ncbi:HpcH/HpaI aldolase family protein [Emergencia sp.]|uniref:HpcH/HpaI aldolase family protein n=1 Tax=Emergencia sp. TaxID=1926557 RepID=UPI003AF088AE
MNMNQIKLKLKKGEPVIGTFVRMNSISMEILGRTGFDFAIIDVEHGVHTMADVSNMIRAAKSVGISPIVRVPGTNPVNAMRALDAGADGVQIPQLTNLEQIKEIAKATRYYPMGERGMCNYVAATGYSTIPFDEHMKTSNEEVLVTIHVENAWAAEHIEEILEIPGIDVVFCGPNDMSESLGVPGQMTHPKVVTLLDKVFHVCGEKGVATGIFVKRPELMPHWIEKGVQYLTCSTDVGIYADYAKMTADEMKRQLAENWKK